MFINVINYVHMTLFFNGADENFIPRSVSYNDITNGDTSSKVSLQRNINDIIIFHNFVWCDLPSQIVYFYFRYALKRICFHDIGFICTVGGPSHHPSNILHNSNATQQTQNNPFLWDMAWEIKWWFHRSSTCGLDQTILICVEPWQHK